MKAGITPLEEVLSLPVSRDNTPRRGVRVAWEGEPKTI